MKLTNCETVGQSLTAWSNNNDTGLLCDALGCELTAAELTDAFTGDKADDIASLIAVDSFTNHAGSTTFYARGCAAGSRFYEHGGLPYYVLANDAEYQAVVSQFAGLSGAAPAVSLTDSKGVTHSIPLSQVVTTRVTNMAGTFTNKLNFAQNISGWDTSNVTDMSNMFNKATKFNTPIAGWDVSNVTDMSGMFEQTLLFNQNINAWDTGSVEDMSLMFSKAKWFNQPLGDWDTSSVENFSDMFRDATKFNQDIGGWNTSSATDMSNMFNGATVFNSPVAAWDTSSVTNMDEMFFNATNINQNLSGWCVQQIPTKPTLFDQNTPAWDKTNRQPKWGVAC